MGFIRPKFYCYVVVRGDSLWEIAEAAYGRGSFWEEISRANRLKCPDLLFAGRTLRLPVVEERRRKKLRPSAQAIQQLNSTLHKGPFAPAPPVAFPPFKYDLSLIKIESTTGPVNYKLSLKGEITLQKAGTISGGVQFTKDAIEAEYKPEVDTTFNKLFSRCNVKIEGNRAEVSLGVGSAAKLGKEVFATSEVSPLPPNGVKYTMQGREIEGESNGIVYKGVLGYELEVRVNDSSRSFATVPSEVKQWSKIIGVSMVAAAAVIVIADIIKDIVTLGGGTVESPLSFAVAADMAGEGLVLVRGAAAAGI